jgi:hypothetical protein
MARPRGPTVIRRIAVGDPQQVFATFPGLATGNVTVDVTREDGEIAVSGAVAASEGSGVYSYVVGAAVPALVAEVDSLTVKFSGTFSGVARSRTEHAEIVGAHYFEIGEVRALPSIDTSYTDTDISTARGAVSQMVERVCGTSFVERYRREVLSGEGRQLPFGVSAPYVRRLLAVTVDGVAWDQTELDTFNAAHNGGRWLDDGVHFWPYGRRNIVVKFAEGFSVSPPEDLRDAGLEATRHALLDGRHVGAHPQAISLTTEAGQFQLARAGLRFPTGYPDVDATVTSWRETVRVGL